MPESALLEAGFTAAQLAEPFELFGPKGCQKCSGGYKGRVGIYEVMKITAEIRKIIMEDGNALQIGEVSEREGFGTIYESGLRKVIGWCNKSVRD